MAGQQSFTAAVDAWVMETERRIEAVFREAAQRVIEEVIERTPVDTGFLRASLTVSLDGPLPIRPDARPVEGGHYDVQPYALVIAGAEIGDTIWASFVAAYAAYVEYGANGRDPRAMVRLAAQRWNAIVDQVVAEVRSRAGG